MVTRSPRYTQNHIIIKKNKSYVFWSKRSKYCCFRMLSPNKSCSKDNLDGVIDMQQYNPLIHQQLRESKIQAVIHIFNCYHWRVTLAKSTELFQAVVQCNVTLNGKFLREEPRNMVQQLLERPKKQCLKFLADYPLTQQYFVAAGTEQWRATDHHLHLCFFS